MSLGLEGACQQWTGETGTGTVSSFCSASPPAICMMVLMAIKGVNMDPAEEVNDAITSYSDWSHPWLFYNYATTRLADRESSQTLFQNAWDEAEDQRHWQSADLASSAKGAASAIREKFPAISEAAARAIARAASFEWR
jgi:hypothetical protein